jgi:acyl dehydratase
MAESNIEDLKKSIGIEGKPLVMEIEKGMIKKFANAIGDTNPLWQDEEYAQKTKYKGIIAPPGIFCAIMMFMPVTSEPKEAPSLLPGGPLPLERVLDGGAEWEFISPVKLGETITSTTKLTRVLKREGKMGKMVFLALETIFKNQENKIVAKSHATIINY